jgi:hypothetical protein
MARTAVMAVGRPELDPLPRRRRALRRRGITPRIARRGIESSQRLGRHRYVVERSLAWLVGYRRLQVRYERRADILLGFVQMAFADLPQTAAQADGLNRASQRFIDRRR